ncbi:MAG: hypothetical protein K2Q28_14235 [Hyphomicrobium sp.]|nr:hypothetical protein [Hyphomicrobium sp.]
MGRINRGGGNGGEPVRSPPRGDGQSGAVRTLFIKMAADEGPADEPDLSTVDELDP